MLNHTREIPRDDPVLFKRKNASPIPYYTVPMLGDGRSDYLTRLMGTGQHRYDKVKNATTRRNNGLSLNQFRVAYSPRHAERNLPWFHRKNPDFDDDALLAVSGQISKWIKSGGVRVIKEGLKPGCCYVEIILEPVKPRVW